MYIYIYGSISCIYVYIHICIDSLYTVGLIKQPILTNTFANTFANTARSTETKREQAQ